VNSRIRPNQAISTNMVRGEVFIGIIVLLVVVVARLVGGGASV
jgi:hypothetical protein